MASAPVAQLPEAEFVKSSKGGEKLICQGFIYRHKHNLKSGAKYWECDKHRSDQCKGACKTVSAGDKTLVEAIADHNHLPTPDVATKLRLKGQMRTQALAQPTASVSNLAAASLQTVDKPQLPFAPTNENLKRAAWRARSADLKKKLREEPAPEPNYASLTDLVLPAVKVHEEEFLLYDSGPGPKRIVLFGTSSTVAALANSETWKDDVLVWCGQYSCSLDSLGVVSEN